MSKAPTFEDGVLWSAAFLADHREYHLACQLIEEAGQTLPRDIHPSMQVLEPHKYADLKREWQHHTRGKS